MSRLSSILVLFLWLALCGGRVSAFLSADPLGHAASMDLYSYCNGDPVNGFDPDGRFGKNADDDFQAGMNYTGLGPLSANAALGEDAVGADIAYGFGSGNGSGLTFQNYDQAGIQGFTNGGLFAGTVATGGIAAELAPSAYAALPSYESLYVGAANISNSNFVLALGGASLAGGAGYQTLEQEAESQAPAMIPQMVQQAQAQASSITGFAPGSGSANLLNEFVNSADEDSEPLIGVIQNGKVSLFPTSAAQGYGHEGLIQSGLIQNTPGTLGFQVIIRNGAPEVYPVSQLNMGISPGVGKLGASTIAQLNNLLGLGGG